MHGAYIGNQRMLMQTLWGGKLITSSEDMSLMPDLMAGGIIEVGLTKFLLNHLTQGQTFVDIGANVGYYSVLAGKKVGANGKVLAFEANPTTYDFLRDNVAINYLVPQTELYQKAVYSEETKLTFYSTDRFPGNASIHKPEQEYYDYFLVDKGMKETEVEAVTLDNSFSDLVMDFVKIDVEGGEYHCLKGMERKLADGTIKNVIFELNQVRSKEGAAQLENWLLNMTEKGFRLWVIDMEGKGVSITVNDLFQYEFIPSVLLKK